MNKINKIKRLLNKTCSDIHVSCRDDIVFLDGELDDWQTIVELGLKVAKTKCFAHVVNNIKLKGYEEKAIKHSSIVDNSLDGKKVDVLVIGGGVVGAATLRELSKYKISSLLVEKEEDLAMQASSRNDGCIHVGIDLHKNSSKLHYLREAVKIYPSLAKDLEIPYRQDGQTVAFKDRWLKFIAPALLIKAKINKIPGVRVLNRKQLLKLEPNIASDVKFAVNFPTAAAICPYNMTIALAESAVINGATVSLNTLVESMDVKDNKIISVKTNRGTIYPKVVINCAGTFADKIAYMADDQFYSIHPRKGTNSILDKNSYNYLSRTGIQVFEKPSAHKKSHSKGGGIIPTIDKNILVGPDAKEVPDREDFSTDSISVSNVFNKHKTTMSNLNKGDIITYFSGIRAATYEEEFVVSKGKWTKNIVHAGGIQSPGLTAAPSIAIDVTKWAIEILGGANINKQFNPHRTAVIETRNLDEKTRDELIKINPDYGQIICRCEEISKGEIIDALHRPIKVTTVDGIKRRVRAGMGRCQGGFCQPLVASIIANENNVDIKEVCKKGEGIILFQDTK